MKPNDMLQVGRDFYEVQGVHLGAVGQENVVELRGITRMDGAAHGSHVRSLLVPLPLIHAAVEGGNAKFFRPASLVG